MATTTSSTANTDAVADATTVEEAKPYKSNTQKVREFVGLHTDADVALLKNDLVRGGLSIALVGINPIAGVAALTYSTGASVRDRQAYKAARNAVPALKPDNA